MSSRTLTITNARLAHPDCPDDRWRLECTAGRVTSVRRLAAADRTAADLDAHGGLVLPSLCHSHIHIDKCFILDRCELVAGDFAEAMSVTSRAKAAFRADDLYRRGCRLVRDSVESGVTSMRAHVEVDTTVQLLCVQAGLKLSKAFRDICDVQVAAFAQEPLFDAPDAAEPGMNYRLLVQAAETPGVRVVGSAPYVEPTVHQAKRNIALILHLALARGCHADFHLDYNLDPAAEPLVFEVVSQAKELSWPSGLGITIGHATRLQLFTPAQWGELAAAIAGLPITFVGLPQSDMYMLGRKDADAALGPPRGTLRIPHIARAHNIQMAMSVNNAQNAFTPQGSVDPLSLCTLGVALFQSATPQDLRTLLRSVTLTSKQAIAQNDVHGDLCIAVNDPADFVVLHGTDNLPDAVLNPAYDRTTVRAGVVVARRHTSRWIADTGEDAIDSKS